MIKRFEGKDIEVLPSDKHEFLLPTRDVAEGYGVGMGTINAHKQNHADELLKDIHFITKDISDKKSGAQWTKRGIIRLGFFIRSEQAKRFRNWIEELAIRELQIIDPLQRSLNVIKQMQVLIEEQIEQKNRLDQVEDQVQLLVGQLVTVTSHQKWRMKEQVNKLILVGKQSHPHRSEGELRKSFWGVLRDVFEVSSYTEIPVGSFDEAMALLFAMEKEIRFGRLDLNGWISPRYGKQLLKGANYYPQKQKTLDI